MISHILQSGFQLQLGTRRLSLVLIIFQLSQICQQVISRFVNTRNVAHYLNAISPCSVTAFKNAGLEYITLQAENLLENHLLENLDKEVMEELDTVVRANQLAHYPFARSGRAELLLREQNPELAQDVEEERQRRVREMAFRASQKDEERKLSSSLKGKFGSLEEFTPVSPSLEKQAGKAKARRNEPFSPDLRPKSTQNDLMFDMDEDEGTIDSPSIRPQRTPDAKRQSELDQIPPLAGSHYNEKQKNIARSPLIPSPAGSDPASPHLASRPASTIPGKSGTPWAAALPTTKLDLRDIMNESSPVHSALSAGLAAQKAKDAWARPQPVKMSQKERKRQQQLQAEREAKASLTPTAKAAWDKSSTDPRPSPWKAVSKDPKSSPKNITPDPQLLALPSTKPLVAVEASAKSIPRRTQSPDTRHSGQSRTPTTAPPVRPPPKPSSASTSTSTFAADDPSKPIVPHSKSYMKPVAKSEPTLGLSMADIIDQERRNREKVKEAVAKRSLMEIQQEQEFQQWWDEESRRTQEEEARRLASQKEREEGKARGRRGRGTKARGRGAGTSGSRPAESETANQQGQDARRGRDNGRGRGRGGVAKTSK